MRPTEPTPPPNGRPPRKQRPGAGTIALGVASALLLLAGGGWVAWDLVAGSQPAPESRQDEEEPPPGVTVRGTPRTTSTTDTTGTTATTGDERTGAGSDRLDEDDPLAELDGVTVSLDPGHNPGNPDHPEDIAKLVPAGNGVKKACDTPGSQSASGYREADYTLDVARRMEALLEEVGAEVVLTHDGDAEFGPCVNERAKAGNEADVAVSIHADGGPPTGRGFHVIYLARENAAEPDIATESLELAQAVRAALRETDIPDATYVGADGLDARSDLAGLNLSTVPKVLVETGNMRSRADMRVLGSKAGRQDVASALVAGLAAYLAVEDESTAAPADG